MCSTIEVVYHIAEKFCGNFILCFYEKNLIFKICGSKFCVSSLLNHTQLINNHSKHLSDMESASVAIESCVRGHHVYQSVWNPLDCEELSCCIVTR